MPVVYEGVGMNFIPSPRMDFAAGGMILSSMRSWKARFSMVGSILMAGIVVRMAMAFWSGDW